MRPSRRAVTVALSAVAAIGLAACSSSGSGGSGGDSGSTIKFAVLEPFSGSFGSYGGLIQKSLEVAADNINKDGGILGHKVEVITRDDALDPTKTVTAARELATDPSVALILGPSFSALYNASKNIFEQNKKPNCAVAVNDDSAFDGLKYGFRAAASISTKVEGDLAYASQNGIKTLGLVVANDDSGQSLDKALKALAPKYGLDYLGVKYFNPGAQSQVPQVTAFKNADAIFVSATVTDAAITASNARDAGFTGKFLGVDGLITNFAYVDVGADKVAGTILTYPGADYLTRIPKSQWPVKYRETIDQIAKSQGYQTDPKAGNFKILNGSSLVADCVTEWAAAAKKANSIDGTKVAQAWENLSLPADEIPTGIPVKFSPDSHEEFHSYKQLGVYSLEHDSQGWYLKQLVAPSLG